MRNYWRGLAEHCSHSLLYLESWQDISTSRQERPGPSLLRSSTTGSRWTRKRPRGRASPLPVAEQEEAVVVMVKVVLVLVLVLVVVCGGGVV